MKIFSHESPEYTSTKPNGVLEYSKEIVKYFIPNIKAERVLMAGNREGGKKAALKNKQLHGEDFYQRIGRRGGKNGHTGGFASNPELAREAGRKGGKKSRRGKSKKTLKEAEGGESAKD